jgi:NADH-quinone oxidoreductase subunit G
VRKKTLVLLNVEPQLDLADPRALAGAEFVVALSLWRPALDAADVLLPIAAFTETSGTFVNTEGRAQSFYATVNPPGEARPGWKVLRVLGSLLGRPGFDFDRIEEVRSACLGSGDIASRLSNRLKPGSANPFKVDGLQRIADVPMYFADPLVRRSPPLQKTKEARPPRAHINSRLAQKLGIAAGQPVRVNGARLEAVLDETVADDCVRVSAAHPSTIAAGPMFGAVALEKLAVERAA